LSDQAASPMRIVLDARLGSGESGGVESVIIGLAYGLSSLDDADDDYLFHVWEDSAEWLAPYVGGPCTLLPSRPRPQQQSSSTKALVKRLLPGTSALARTVRSLHGPAPPEPERSDGTVEATGADLVHFPTQRAFISSLPTIYHPHDLQHRHFPQYFTPEQLAVRELVWATYVRQATLVAVSSSWVKSDVVAQLGVPPENIAVVPLAPVTSAYGEPTPDDLARVRLEYQLPDRFAFYPAQTWPHKNHLTLLEALALLRATRDLVVPLVFSGRRNEFYGTIERAIERLGLRDSVRFCDFVSPRDLQCLYKLATAVVIPTKFEAASGPLWEAFLSGAPVACSNVTSLPEQAGDAALLFDPSSPVEIAEAVRRLWTDARLRATLADRGHASVRRFSWQRTARHFRAHYRRIAGRSLTAADAGLLAAPPLL